MIKEIAALITAYLLLTGCASSSLMYGADGEQQYNIECNGSLNPMSTCYKKALKLCPNGYYLTDQQKTVDGPFVFGGPMHASMGQRVSKSITIKCK